MDRHSKTSEQAVLGILGANEHDSTQASYAAPAAFPATPLVPAVAMTHFNRDTAWIVAQNMDMTDAKSVLLVDDPRGLNPDFLRRHGAYVRADWTAGDAPSNPATRPSRGAFGWMTAVALISVFALGVTYGGVLVRVLLA